LLLKANDMDHVLKRIESLSVAASNRESRNEKNYEIILSVGIYIIDKVNYRMDTSIDRASLTKKSIKGKHSQIYAIYDEKIRQKVLRDQEIENMMERALRNEEFKVYYQPKYDSTTCELTGAEALVRWYNDEIGMIFPNEFISVFENNGFISELDKYMFEHVCMDIRSWLDEGYNVVPVSVNLSQLQLYNLRFVEEYKEILKKYDIPSEYIQLELTETTLFSKVNSLNKIIDELHKIGFKILMDDFGTGYSSLNMLKNVPVDILKLDKSFVDDIGEPKGDIVVSTIVSLGQLLNMRIIAEGVETKEQYEFLRDIFCDEIQGYYFSKPIPEGEYRKEMMKGAL
ncbi:MAG: EAL domain-containing protein, partial [Lachnospiraceae bacterium]|nr:EAL domain-containing protein [Lachnospiraceae bacterium]